MSFRPTIPETPRTNRIHIRVTDAEHADLTAKATALGITISDLVRRIAGLPTANVSEARRDAARAKAGTTRTPTHRQPDDQPAPTDRERARDAAVIAASAALTHRDRMAGTEALSQDLLDDAPDSPAPTSSQPDHAPNPEPAPFIPPWGRR